MRQEFLATTQQLSQLPLSPAQLAALERIREREGKLFQVLGSQQRSGTAVTELADGYAALVEQTQGMVNATTELTQRAIERLQDTAQQGREKWLYVALATVVAAVWPSTTRAMHWDDTSSSSADRT